MKVKQNDGIAWQVYDGEAVLVDPAGAICRVLNETASSIWRACEHPVTVAEMVACICEEYACTPGEVDRDVREFVAELLAEGLLVEVGPPERPEAEGE